MGYRLSGKVAIITGGASGMGLAATEMFVEQGASVVVADIQADKGPSLEARFDGKVRFAQCDVREESAIAAAVAKAVDSFGGLDIMYHSAGIGGIRASIEEMPAELWDDTQDVLLRSSMLCIKHAVGPMKKRGRGSIVLTSSVAAINLGGGIGAAAYIVAKAGVITLCRAAALELGPSDIRVNTIVPGFVPTPLVGDAIGAPKPVADRMGVHMREIAATMQPLPRSGDPKNIAHAALYLASDESEFVTGTALTVDGGLSIHRKADPAVIFDHFQEARRRAEAELAAEH